ncbi:hypothetical protein GH714_037206 [Hevea brasiliensis]|uniref:ERAP1-like C-terminal domain-containing protein n=1 Tax=Hevea brasiliensis TaxID=3981 RepID=A0A6A6KDT9_HEVBR|nr:hypothetical protein GH714_037206 [Hevea brasiliensis]
MMEAKHQAIQDLDEMLGWDPIQGESHLDAMLRGEILTALAVFGHDPTLNEASKRFHAFVDDRNTPLLPSDIRKAAYMAVMQRVSTSNRSGFEYLLRFYGETDLSQERTRILSSLASCPDPNIVLEVLNFVSSSEVRSQDAVFGLAVSKEGRETAWTWLKFASFEKAKEVEEFFASRTISSVARTLKQSIERVNVNAKRARFKKYVAAACAAESIPSPLYPKSNMAIAHELDKQVRMKYSVSYRVLSIHKLDALDKV